MSNSNIVPLKLRPHLVSFLMTEMQGESKSFAGYRCKILNIPGHSFVGSFLLEHLEKIDYPVKNIQTFNMFLDVKATSRKRFVSKGSFYKIESLGRSYVYLPQEFAETVNNIFEQHFRNSFFHYVDARVDNGNCITRSILAFIDKYDLFEVNFTQAQLRQLYYKLKKEGLCFSLNNNLRRK
ncbi:hypothetical protein [Chryseobacterium sp. MP_3.2]|uniref:hypothetical protein n=1 Tax=Chryseobacterium sp. MP_3.2 TaxID=3071712 RepID=UPI002E0A4174|nr:hypothetical protein [Chryseobacterium sp. MP_3.2]